MELVFHKTHLRKKISYIRMTHHMRVSDRSNQSWRRLLRKGPLPPSVPLGTGLRLLRLCQPLKFSPTFFLSRCHLFSSLVPCSCHLSPFMWAFSAWNPLPYPEPYFANHPFSFPWWEHTHGLQHWLQPNTPTQKSSSSTKKSFTHF